MACCEHCPGDFDNVVTRTDLEDAVAQLQSTIAGLQNDIEDLQDRGA